MIFNDEHSLKQPISIDLTKFGTEIDVKDKHLRKQ
jgi:hypothetical protein